MGNSLPMSIELVRDADRTHAAPLRVLFIVPSLARAGAETQVVNLVNGIDTRSFIKNLFTFEARLDQLERIDRVHVAFHNRPRHHKYDFRMVGEIARVIDAEKIDVVHCTLQIALLMGWLGVRRASRKPALVAALHTTINRNRKDELLDFGLYQWLLRSCHKVLFVCQAQQDRWLKRFPALTGRSAVIYNGIDTAYFSLPAVGDAGLELRKKLDITPEDLVVACVAGFRPEKAHSLLLDAFKEVLAKGIRAHLLLAGDGPTRAALAERVRTDGLDARVHLLGALQDVRPVLAAADVNVISSVAVETFSIAMLEAMAMEVPVIATDLGGAREALVEHDAGLVVPAGDARALAAAMIRFLTGDECRGVGRTGRHAVETYFSMEKMVEETSALLWSAAAASVSASQP